MTSVRLGTRSEGGLTGPVNKGGSYISQLPHHPQIDTPPTKALTDKLEMKRGDMLWIGYMKISWYILTWEMLA